MYPLSAGRVEKTSRQWQFMVPWVLSQVLDNLICVSGKKGMDVLLGVVLTF